MTVIETPAGMGAGLRWLAGLAVASAPLAAVAATFQAWRERLPDPMPIHWGAGNQVDDTASLTTVAASLAVIAAAGLLVAAIGTVVRTLSHRTRRVVVAVGAGAGALGGGLWLVIALLALDVPEAHQARSPTWHLVAFTAVLLGLPVLAFLVCPPPPPHPAVTAGRPAGPRLDLRPGERAAYTEVNYPSWGTKLVLGLAALPAVPLAIWASPWVTAPLLLTLVVTFLLMTTRLTVDSRGLRVGFGPWAWPRVVVRLDEIAAAHTTTVRPMEWGGWGYRVRPDGSRGVINRSGPGVRLTLSGERQLVVTTRDPDTIVGLLNTLADQLRR